MTPRLLLRPLALDDADVMATVLADPSLYEFTGGEPPTRDDLARRYAVQVRGHSGDGSERWINSVVVLGPEHQPIGYVQATIPVNDDQSGDDQSSDDRSSDGRVSAGCVSTGPAEIAWVIGRPWQGNGHAGRAARLLLDDLAEQGIKTVVAHIHPDHEASQRIATRLGLTPTTIVVDGEIRWEGTTAQS